MILRASYDILNLCVIEPIQNNVLAAFLLANPDKFKPILANIL